MIAELLLEASYLENWHVFVMTFFSLLYFVVVVLGVIFLTSKNFKVNPERLAFDTLISMISCILSFALIYRVEGFSLSEVCVKVESSRDAIYFSAVTFSTLGYGDFRPCPDARIYSAIQAMVGNLHLGLIVGSAFLLANSSAGDED